MTTSPPPPVGTTWVSDWDGNFADRFFVGSEVEVDVLDYQAVSVRLSGCRHASGLTVTNLRLAIDAGEAVDLTPAQAGQLAAVLLARAEQAERLDGA